MNREDDLLRENEALRERLSRLSQASLRINESLDESEQVQDFLSSGFTADEARGCSRAAWTGRARRPP